MPSLPACPVTTSPLTHEVTFQRRPRGHCYYKTAADLTHRSSVSGSRGTVIWIPLLPPLRAVDRGVNVAHSWGDFALPQLLKLFTCRRSLSSNSLTSCCSLNSVGGKEKCVQGELHTRLLRCGSAFCFTRSTRGNNLDLFKVASTSSTLGKTKKPE